MQLPPSGILVFDKPLGISSMAAVARVRRAAGGVRTGHAGTLDPLATGVLVMALGKATRLISRLMETEKRYLTTIDLSAFTTTDDREGERTEVSTSQPPTAGDIRRALRRFTGPILQRPPAFSAMKIGGRRAYKLARQGKPPELAPRPVVIHELSLVAFDWPMLTIDMRCGKGVYVRSLARDLGTELGVGGHCAELRRTAVGPFTIARATTIDAMPAILEQQHLISPEEAIAMVDAAAVPHADGVAGSPPVA